MTPGGAEPPREDPAPDHDPPPVPSAEPLTAFQRAVLGAVIGILYAIGMIARGNALPGIVGGTLAAILCYLVLRRVGERQRSRARARGR